MSFLQPLFLVALPLVALPVIIHLINQRRYQTIHWAAMMFLLTANRMSRGYARLRQWLILLLRMLAVLGLILAITRPLASGRLGMMAGGQVDTTIILLDRSPSMQQQDVVATVSKLEAGRDKLVATLNKLGSTRWVLVDSASREAREIDSPDTLSDLPSAEACDTSADIPAMLESARDYIDENRTGRTEIWICSDARSNDWRADSGQWQALRDAFASFSQGIRFHLLAYAEPSSENVSIRVTSVRRQDTAEGAEVLVSLRLQQDADTPQELTVPLVFEIEGARSEMTVEMTSSTFELRDHSISIDARRSRGWGKVSIPSDSNPADNAYYFVFDRPVGRHTLVVSDDRRTILAIQLAASVAPEVGVECTADVIAVSDMVTTDWDAASLIVWHAPLPEKALAESLISYVDRGGQIMFLPPTTVATQQFLGIGWSTWSDDIGAAAQSWRGDQGVLANAQSGRSLPVGDLIVRRCCGLDGEVTPLATLIGGRTLLARVPTSRGGVYFCCTTPHPKDSSLAADGVVLYVMVHRAIAAGAAAQSHTRQVESGSVDDDSWKQVAGPPGTLSTAYGHHAGVYGSGDRLLAVNRSVDEDQAVMLSTDQTARLFTGLSYSRVDDRAGSLAGLVQEIWRMFLLAMMAAVVGEAILCLPRRPGPRDGDRPQGFSNGAGAIQRVRGESLASGFPANTRSEPSTTSANQSEAPRSSL